MHLDTKNHLYFDHFVSFCIKETFITVVVSVLYLYVVVIVLKKLGF